MNLAGLLEDTAARTPDAVAISFEGADVTYGQLLSRARGAAATLAGRGVGRGDRVALWLGNHPSFAAVMYGAWRLGAVVVPMHSALTEPEARHIFGDSGAKLVLCGIQQREVAPLLGEVLFAGELPDDGEATSVVDTGDDDLALIQYTAGTSGLPKGAMLTHANLRANIDQMKQVPIAIGPGDVALCVLPLFHIFGLNVVLNLAVEAGAKVVLTERFDAARSLELIRAHSITQIAGAPPAYVAWLALSDVPADAFASVRVAVSGAAPLSKEVLDGFRTRFGVTIWEGYGLTETSPALTSTSIGGEPKPNCVGRPLPGVELRLVDDDGDDVEEEGDPGDIVVRGPNVFAGYWNHPMETEATFRDGWFITGDVGVLDGDGDLFIVDRHKDLVIVSGFNVYPREVEDVLRRHPKVGDCAVVGIHDDKTGERVRAIVVADPPGEGVTSEELIEFCRKSLAPYKVPREIEITNDIPRNAAGKVLRRELK